MKQFLLIFLLILLVISNSHAGSYFSQYESNATVISAVQIKSEGIFNLVVSGDFLSRPRDKKLFSSDEYDELINRLRIEWRDIATQKILDSGELTVAGLTGLRSTIKTDVQKLVDRLKSSYFPEKNVEVVFSISNFFLLEPCNEKN